MYVRSASSGSVMIVAGLELTSTVFVALVAQGLAGLRAGVVEFARLSDDDGARTHDHDLLDVGPFRHRPFSVSESVGLRGHARSSISWRNSSNR